MVYNQVVRGMSEVREPMSVIDMLNLHRECFRKDVLAMIGEELELIEKDRRLVAKRFSYIYDGRLFDQEEDSFGSNVCVSIEAPAFGYKVPVLFEGNQWFIKSMEVGGCDIGLSFNVNNEWRFSYCDGDENQRLLCSEEMIADENAEAAVALEGRARLPYGLGIGRAFSLSPREVLVTANRLMTAREAREFGEIVKFLESQPDMCWEGKIRRRSGVLGVRYLLERGKAGLFGDGCVGAFVREVTGREGELYACVPVKPEGFRRKDGVYGLCVVREGLGVRVQPFHHYLFWDFRRHREEAGG